jgi:helicase, recD/traA family
MISELARLANNGAFPAVIGETEQTYFRHMYAEQIDNAIEKDYCAMIDSGRFKPEEIQILSPVRQGLASVKSLNERIQAYWKLQGELSAEFVYANGYQIREGDRVMITTSLPNEGLVNGDIGYVMHIGAREIVVEIGGDSFRVPRIRANNGRKYFPLELAYAITTHKSQGGEFPLVLYALRPGVDYWAKRNALYTAITRAKKYLVMYGDVDTYVRVALQEGNRRKTRLQWALSDALENALFFSYDF